MTAILGLDPGNSGAIACIDDSGEPSWIKLDSTETDIARAVASWDAEHVVNFAFIERVHSMPKQGVASSFKFGQSYGFLRGVLVALSIPFEEVAPSTWLRAVGLPAIKDEPRTARLNRVKALGQQLFPGVKVTHANGAALLIAEYGRRTWMLRNGREGSGAGSIKSLESAGSGVARHIHTEPSGTEAGPGARTATPGRS